MLAVTGCRVLRFMVFQTTFLSTVRYPIRVRVPRRKIHEQGEARSTWAVLERAQPNSLDALLLRRANAELENLRCGQWSVRRVTMVERADSFRFILSVNGDSVLVSSSPKKSELDSTINKSHLLDRYSKKA